MRQENDYFHLLREQLWLEEENEHHDEYTNNGEEEKKDSIFKR